MVNQRRLSFVVIGVMTVISTGCASSRSEEVPLDQIKPIRINDDRLLMRIEGIRVECDISSTAEGVFFADVPKPDSRHSTMRVRRTNDPLRPYQIIVDDVVLSLRRADKNP
jgi:hypothetical protein